MQLDISYLGHWTVHGTLDLFQAMYSLHLCLSMTALPPEPLQYLPVQARNLCSVTAGEIQALSLGDTCELN